LWKKAGRKRAWTMSPEIKLSRRLPEALIFTGVHSTV
jgi:hypothetical protein